MCHLPLLSNCIFHSREDGKERGADLTDRTEGGSRENRGYRFCIEEGVESRGESEEKKRRNV
jgi:hypothetical protein